MTVGIPIQVDDVEPERREAGEMALRRRRLGVAAGAAQLGVAIIDVDPGAQSFPPHSHADEDEVFLVLAGSGLSYQTSGSKDVRTYAIGVDDVLIHPANGDAHTLIAGPDGLTVLVVAEGSRTNVTWLPRTKQFWLGPRWSPADTPPPFAAHAALDPLDVPDPTPQRPPTVRNLSELTVNEGREGKLAYVTRDAREMQPAQRARLVLAHDAMPPDTHNTDLHFHSTREECWYVRGGSGIARRGDEAHELRAGSFWLEPPNTGVGHRIEVGPDGMDLITMGDLVPGDVCVYPELGYAKIARGARVPYEAYDA